jgi:hypothetical protein
MFNKTRTTIITLVAAFSVAGVAVVPTATQAMGIKIITPVTGCRNGAEITTLPHQVIIEGEYVTVHEVYRCNGGKWELIEVGYDREAPPTSPTSQEHVTTAPPVKQEREPEPRPSKPKEVVSPLPVAGGAAG